MDEIGKHHLERAAKLVRDGHSFVIVLDNIDWEVQVHDAREKSQNTSVHAVASSLVFDRVRSSHLPDIAPQQDLTVLTNNNLIYPTFDECHELRTRYKHLVARIIADFIPFFQFL